MVNPLFTKPVYHGRGEEGDPIMIGIAMLAAAAQAPVLLASNEEARWRLFVRASLQRPAPAPRLEGGSRLLQLQGAVRRLAPEYEREARRLAGPSGL